MVRSSAVASACIALAGWSAYAVTPPKSDAVLSVVAKSATKGWFGTAFLISDDGQALTCYHVIRSATDLSVWQGKAVYKIEVVAIAPDYDLAVIKLNGFPKPGAFLPLSEQPPSAYFGEELKVYGNPGRLSGQELDAKLTKADYVPSGEFRTPDERGDPIFRSPKVNLLPLSMNLLKGVSGGPVVSRAGVVGVLSGSFNEGGTIAWAIPTMYAATGRMSQIHLPVERISNWPELTLMTNENTFNMLRFDVSITAGLILAIDSYITSVDEFSVITHRALVQRPAEVVTLLGEDREILKSVGHSRQQQNEAIAAMKDVNRRMLDVRAAIEKEVEELRERAKMLLSRLHALRTELDSFQALLPDTPRNRDNASKASEALMTVAGNLISGGTELESLNTDSMNKLLKFRERLKKARTNNDMIRALKEEQGIIREQGANNEPQLTRIVTSFRQIGDVAESLLNSDLKAPSAQ